MPIPALVASHAGIWRADEAGETGAISRGEASRRLAETPHLLLGAPQLATRLGLAEASGLDLLELWAFVHPARFLVPSMIGLAGALSIEAPASGEGEARFLQRAAKLLLETVSTSGWAARAGAAESLARLHRHGWPWASLLHERLAAGSAAPSIFEALPEWREAEPRAAPLLVELTDAMVEERLAALAGKARPPRPGQQAYARAALAAFQPRQSKDGPNLVVAEAGTGTGKTLGYLAPASLYAEKTGGAVWLSTYTRALQRQLRAETGRSLPGPTAAGGIVVRKGRENYLCLLNLEDALQGGFTGRAASFAELVARWARFSRDGDMVGGDLPGWLSALFRNRSALPALTDRRGECIHAACPHYRRCFIERSIRDSAKASLVVANHALVMANAVRERGESRQLQRIVFDEGHHLHHAADSAFSLLFSGSEAIELRRWLLGPETPRRRAGRRRGLAARLSEILSGDGETSALLDGLLHEAGALPATGWLARLAADAPAGPLEALFSAIRAHVLTNAEGEERGFSLECAIAGLPPGLPEATDAAAAALARLSRSMRALRARLLAPADERPEWLDQPGLARVAAGGEGLALRLDLVGAWERLLARVTADAEEGFVDWLQLSRAEGREVDCGIERHFLDPMQPLAEAVLTPAHGVLVTSATLSDPPEAAAGAAHLATPAHVFRAESPFRYAEQARIWIATDVDRRHMASLAHAYAALVEAAGGGTLGLFTAISRLRAVHARLADRLARAGLPLYAQHVDAVDTGTLVDLFRADPKASLFGTDALRDGIDVPGDSLRLIVFEGVPWSRPTILHMARKNAFGGGLYEDMLVRQRLRQAFGRLIRNERDRGGFVLLGPAVPSRLLSAFPPEVPVHRLPLMQVAAEARAFLAGAFSHRHCEAPPSPLETGRGESARQ